MANRKYADPAVYTHKTPLAGTEAVMLRDGTADAWCTAQDIASLAATGSGNVNGQGTYATAPASPAQGDTYQCTDAPLRMVRGASAWRFYNCDQRVVPPTGISTWMNQGTATIVQPGPLQGILAPAAVGNDNLRGRYKTLAATSNYTVTALLEFTDLSIQYCAAGLMLYDSASGKLVAISIVGRSTAASLTSLLQTIGVGKWNSPTSANAYYINEPYAHGNRIWFRFIDDGTTRRSLISRDGYVWVQIHSVGRTDFLTPDSVGFFVSPGQNTYPAGVLCLSFEETTP